MTLIELLWAGRGQSKVYVLHEPERFGGCARARHGKSLRLGLKGAGRKGWVREPGNLVRGDERRRPFPAR
jgi:hypothetical protein